MYLRKILDGSGHLPEVVAFVVVVVDVVGLVLQLLVILVLLVVVVLRQVVAVELGPVTVARSLRPLSKPDHCAVLLSSAFQL